MKSVQIRTYFWSVFSCNWNKYMKIRTRNNSVFGHFSRSVKNNRLILKTQQKFKSERHNVFTEEINKIALSSNDDNIIQSNDSIETYIERVKLDDFAKENIKEDNPNWPLIPDHPYRILIIGESGSGKTNSLFRYQEKPHPKNSHHSNSAW